MTRKELRYVVCDVFTDRPLTGNPLAVFTDGRGLDARVMQDIAREMNLSETVFVFPAEHGGSARVRIFTPRCEIPFAGHPVLGAAFVLGGPLQTEVVKLETGVGIIPVRLEREGARITFGWMEQRVPTATELPPSFTTDLFAALGVAGSELPVIQYDNGMRHLYVLLSSPEAVAQLRPDLGRIEQLTSAGVNVSAGADRDWKTRMFAPHSGVPEDPATGSAAGPLAVHLTRHGRAPFGEILNLAQGAELQRPSQLFARVTGAPDRIQTVEVGGQAVLVARGELRPNG
jgi:trans-2,3-dihydro-3-hydroxyanthranilate isomerase